MIRQLGPRIPSSISSLPLVLEALVTSKPAIISVARNNLSPMITFHGCHSSSSHCNPHHLPNHPFPCHPFHTANHQQPFLQHPSHSLPHTLHPFVHQAQSLGIDFESTRKRNPSLISSTTKRSFHDCQTTFHYHPQHPPNNLEFSPATEDRLEAILVKLIVAQRRLDSTLDALLLKLPLRTNHHYPPSSVESPPPPPPPMPIPPSSSSFTQTFLTHTPIPPLPLPLPLPLKPTPSPTLTAPTTMPTPPSRPTLMSKPQASFPSHRILLSDLGLFSSVTFIAIVKDTELDHPFLPFYATIDTAKWFRFRNTHLHALISSPILIWDPDSHF
ncbi:hypothetical protein HKD37_19G054054 [Glycine soja]